MNQPDSKMNYYVADWFHPAENADDYDAYGVDLIVVFYRRSEPEKIRRDEFRIFFNNAHLDKMGGHFNGFDVWVDEAFLEARCARAVRLKYQKLAKKGGYEFKDDFEIAEFLPCNPVICGDSP